MNDFSKDAKIFKALCDTKRLTILDYLKREKNVHVF